LQKYFDDHSWWEKTTEKNPLPGRLIWAFIPHIDVIPKSLTPIGRAEDEASNHNKASYEIAVLRIKSHFQKNALFRRLYYL
jgi:hypothetical protein